MNFINSLLGIPLGYIMWLCYKITHNYTLSLLIFTLITRVIMIPMAIKQQKSTVKMNIIKPEMEELQKKYAKNPTKLNEEMSKLYQREGFNPMSGCLPLLIQLPILFGLIDVIYKPLTHIIRLGSEAIEAGQAVLTQLGVESARANVYQLDIIRKVNEGSAEMISALGPDAVASIQSVDLNLFGIIDLTQIPTVAFNALLIIPILAGVSSLAMSLITTRISSGTMDGAGAGTMKGMMLMMPVFSTMFTFSVPAGVGIYWFFSNIIGTAQTLLMNKLYNPKEAAEKAKQEMEERRERERMERIEAKKNNPNKGLSQKEINRRKLAEARRRAAEKYGEEYKEADDGDLI